MSGVRRPRPPREISLASMIVDFEASLQGADTLCAVEVPGVEWNLFLQRAQDELEAQERGDMPRMDARDHRASSANVAELEELRAFKIVAERELLPELEALRAFKAEHTQCTIRAAGDLANGLVELAALREFKAGVVKAMGGQEWAGDNYLIEAIATDRLRSEQLKDQRLAALDDTEIADAELVELRAFKAKAEPALEAYLAAGHKEARRAASVLAKEALALGRFEATPPPRFKPPFSVVLDEKGVPGRFLLDDDDTPIEFDDRQAAVDCARREGWRNFRVTDVNDAVCDIVGPPASEPKKKRERTPKAAPKTPEQVELADAIGGAS